MAASGERSTGIVLMARVRRLLGISHALTRKVLVEAVEPMVAVTVRNVISALIILGIGGIGRRMAERPRRYLAFDRWTWLAVAGKSLSGIFIPCAVRPDRDRRDSALPFEPALLAGLDVGAGPSGGAAASGAEGRLCWGRYSPWLVRRWVRGICGGSGLRVMRGECGNPLHVAGRAMFLPFHRSLGRSTGLRRSEIPISRHGKATWRRSSSWPSSRCFWARSSSPCSTVGP